MDPKDFDDEMERKGVKVNLDITSVTWALGKMHQFLVKPAGEVCKQITFSRKVFVLVCFFLSLFLVEVFSSWHTYSLPALSVASCCICAFFPLGT